MIKEFSKGATVIIDKPLHWTSFDVVNKIRWHLKQRLEIKKIKVGHAGTLDPLATGVLVLCVGSHTKRIDDLMKGEKTYTGTILLGKTTPSYDLETEYNNEFPIDHINDELIENARQKFIGEIDQVPPIFSAKQIDGQRAYDLARKGKEVILEPNKITIRELILKRRGDEFIDFEVCCSKGTYIRSLAHDIGRELNSGGTLIELRRTASGEQKIENSRSVEEMIDFIRQSPME